MKPIKESCKKFIDIVTNKKKIQTHFKQNSKKKQKHQ